ncbi:MAG: (2Fe-2S)-binding protein [Myxococcales bacterium]|nr:(2Fe-2S)-binding protein [Myxococcales bacterium]
MSTPRHDSSRDDAHDPAAAEAGPGARPALVPVRFEPSGVCVQVAVGTKLLEAARAAGLPVASACGADGVCARCGMRVLEGADALAPETPREVEIKRRNRIDAELRLACRTEVRAPLVATTTYW